jgi:hypothetical protein
MKDEQKIETYAKTTKTTKDKPSKRGRGRAEDHGRGQGAGGGATSRCIHFRTLLAILGVAAASGLSVCCARLCMVLAPYALRACAHLCVVHLSAVFGTRLATCPHAIPPLAASHCSHGAFYLGVPCAGATWLSLNSTF